MKSQTHPNGNIEQLIRPNDIAENQYESCTSSIASGHVALVKPASSRPAEDVGFDLPARSDPSFNTVPSTSAPSDQIILAPYVAPSRGASTTPTANAIIEGRTWPIYYKADS